MAMIPRMSTRAVAAESIAGPSIWRSLCEIVRLIAAPPHVLFARGIADGELVLRRAAGVGTGLGAQRAFRGDNGLAAAKREFIKRGRAVIPVNLAEIFETEFVGAEGTVVHARLFH